MNTNRFQKLKLSLLTLWARLEMSLPYVCYGILLAVLINLDLNKTTMIKHMRSVTRTPNSHRRTVNNYLLYNIGVNIPYTVACKPSHLLAPKVISPSACKQKHTSVYKFFPRI